MDEKRFGDQFADPHPRVERRHRVLKHHLDIAPDRLAPGSIQPFQHPARDFQIVGFFSQFNDLQITVNSEHLLEDWGA